MTNWDLSGTVSLTLSLCTLTYHDTLAVDAVRRTLSSVNDSIKCALFRAQIPVCCRYQEQWLNLGPINQGLQQYNVTFQMINDYYKGIQDAGFHSLSYVRTPRRYERIILFVKLSVTVRHWKLGD